MRTFTCLLVMAVLLLLPLRSSAETSEWTWHTVEKEPFTREEVLTQYAATAIAFKEVTKLDISEEQMSEVWGRVWSLSWATDPFKCNLPHLAKDKKCRGLTGTFAKADHRTYWTVSVTDVCVTKTSFVHEMLHILSREFLGTWDRQHTNKALWDELSEKSALNYARLLGVMQGTCNRALKNNGGFLEWDDVVIMEKPDGK